MSNTSTFAGRNFEHLGNIELERGMDGEVLNLMPQASSGRTTQLTGAAGEFLVAAELCRLNLLATPFAGNVPHYDIIASGQSGGHLAVQVKAINGQNWQFDIRKFADVSLEGDRQTIGQRKPEPFPNLTT